MNRMRKLLCPQCKISGMYVKNATGERLLVYVSDKGKLFLSMRMYRQKVLI